MPKVLNRHHNPNLLNAIYIGRGTAWGNPYVVGVHGTREEVIKLFEELVLSDPNHLEKLLPLRGKDLLCSCAPKRCHGDVLLRLANPSLNLPKPTLSKFIIEDE